MTVVFQNTNFIFDGKFIPYHKIGPQNPRLKYTLYVSNFGNLTFLLSISAAFAQFEICISDCHAYYFKPTNFAKQILPWTSFRRSCNMQITKYYPRSSATYLAVNTAGELARLRSVKLLFWMQRGLCAEWTSSKKQVNEGRFVWNMYKCSVIPYWLCYNHLDN